MNKIPVWSTIRSAYIFTFKNMGTIIGLVWLPMIVVAVLGFFAFAHYFDQMEIMMSEENPSAAGSAMAPLFVFILLALFAVAMIAVAVARQALGLNTGTSWLQFGFGATEFRMFGALVAFLLILIAVSLLFALVVGVLALLGGALGGQVGQIASGGVAIAAAVAFVVGMIFISVRLSFVLVPVTVMERKVDLIRVWSLTRGNFWRALAVLLAVLLPVSAVFLAIQWAVFGAAILPMDQVTQAASKSSEMAARMHEFRQELPVLFGLLLLMAPLGAGLKIGAMAAAYRALVPAAT